MYVTENVIWAKRLTSTVIARLAKHIGLSQAVSPPERITADKKWIGF
jgi:hypothetical protein